MPNFGASRLGFWYRAAGAVISNRSEINVLYDTSGSMNSAIPGIQDMVNNQLRNRLIQYYGSTAAYNLRASYAGYGGERLFAQLARPRKLNDSDLVINIAFQDESTEYLADDWYTDWQLGPTYAGPYLTDRSNLLNVINTSPVPVYTVIFQVSGYTSFKMFLQTVQNGFGNYANAGVNLRQLYLGGKINFIYDVSGYGTGQYYTELVATALSYFKIKI